jgi:hypothetical protein
VNGPIGSDPHQLSYAARVVAVSLIRGPRFQDSVRVLRFDGYDSQTCGREPTAEPLGRSRCLKAQELVSPPPTKEREDCLWRGVHLSLGYACAQMVYNADIRFALAAIEADKVRHGETPSQWKPRARPSQNAARL